jgi:hypothetical protein
VKARFLEALVDAPKRSGIRRWSSSTRRTSTARRLGEAESAGAVKDLATRGRKRGFCAVLATQRLSKLHKDAAAECNNKLIGRTSLDVDVKRAATSSGSPKEQLASCCANSRRASSSPSGRRSTEGASTGSDRTQVGRSRRRTRRPARAWRSRRRRRRRR